MHAILAQPWFWPAVAVTFAAAFVQGLTGFGMGLVAVSLLLAPMRKLAVPCVTFAALVTVGMVLWHYWRQLDFSRALWLGVPMLLTTPFGVWLLDVLPLPHLKFGVGGVLAATSLWSLLEEWRTGRADRIAPLVAAPGPLERATLPPKQALGTCGAPFSRTASAGVGALSGVLGGATGMVGVLMAAYLIRTKIPRGTFKATLNAVFLASILFRIGNYALVGLLPVQLAAASLMLMPLAWLGTRTGVALDRYLPKERFTTLVHLFLLGMGLWMLLQGRGVPGR